MATALLDRPGDRPKSALWQFFHAQEVPYGMALVRIFMPLPILCVMLPRWFHARELYSTDGASAPLAVGFGFESFLPEFSGTVVVALHSALILCLVSTSIGWCTRVSVIAATVLYTYLNLLDCISSLTKYSVIATHALLLLSLSNCGGVWSVDNWLRKRRSPLGTWPGELHMGLSRSAVWPRRLLQFLVGAVYFGAALTKLHTPAFFSGDQLQSWLATNYNNHNPLGERLWMYPALIIVFGYITIVWEILFIFVAWRSWPRILMLTLGALFHIMTTFTLGLYIFPIVSITSYFAFVNENDVQKLGRLVRRLRRKWGWTSRTAFSRITRRRRIPMHLPVPSPVVYAAVLAVVVVGGVELEYRLDPYGERRPEGPHSLVELEPEKAAELLSPTGRIRIEDKLQSFDVGTLTLGGVLANRKTDFRHGDLVIGQCTFIHPHEDLWVECDLQDAESRIISSVGNILGRDAMRIFFSFRLNDVIEPGEYHLIVKTGGREVTRRRIYLHERTKSPVAN